MVQYFGNNYLASAVLTRIFMRFSQDIFRVKAQLLPVHFAKKKRQRTKGICLMFHFQSIFLLFCPSYLKYLKWSALIATHEPKLLIELLQMLCLIILISHKKGWWCKLFSRKYFLWCFEMGWLFESSGINFTERHWENQGCIWSIIIWCLLLHCTLGSHWGIPNHKILIKEFSGKY